jgi:prevent-host-death family protein
MKTATITEAKNGLSALLDRVRHGETILITDRGVPVARVEPVTSGSDPTGRLDRLERAGIIRRGKGSGKPNPLILKPPIGVARPGASVVDALIEERRSGR